MSTPNSNQPRLVTADLLTASAGTRAALSELYGRRGSAVDQYGADHVQRRLSPGSR